MSDCRRSAKPAVASTAQTPRRAADAPAATARSRARIAGVASPSANGVWAALGGQHAVGAVRAATDRVADQAAMQTPIFEQDANDLRRQTAAQGGDVDACAANAGPSFRRGLRVP
jgi:hypothetical protein